mgnify:CR=1 FL=1|jgi:hypothetical protein
MQVVVMGGSGFVGQGILAYLARRQDMKLISLSRGGEPRRHTQAWMTKVEWLKSDITQDKHWQPAVATADWVIDAVGILFENPRRGQTYQNASVQPAKRVIDFIADRRLPTHFLFISANQAPFFLKRYLAAKLIVEHDLKRMLPDRSVCVYPNIIYDRARLYSYIPAVLLNLAGRFPVASGHLQSYRPISRRHFSREIGRILMRQKSPLTKRRV